MKAERKNFKGIEYIEVAELPQVQREKIHQTFNRNLLIKILIDNKVVSDCIQFKDYSLWYDTVFTNRPQVVVKESVSTVVLSGKLALDKI